MLKIEQRDDGLYLASDDGNAENAEVSDRLHDTLDLVDIAIAWDEQPLDDDGWLRLRLTDPLPVADWLEGQPQWADLAIQIRTALGVANPPSGGPKDGV